MSESYEIESRKQNFRIIIVENALSAHARNFNYEKKMRQNNVVSYSRLDIIWLMTWHDTFFLTNNNSIPQEFGIGTDTNN